jgi:alpha,alpha-trehalase
MSTAETKKNLSTSDDDEEEEMEEEVAEEDEKNLDCYDHDSSKAHGMDIIENLKKKSVDDLFFHSQRSFDVFPKQKHRRGSHDAKSTHGRSFYIHVEQTHERILKQEDTDGDFQITISDKGPKLIPLGTLGLNSHEIRGTYPISNLLQELTLASDYNRQKIVLKESRIFENPVKRLSRYIKHHFWDALTRRIDEFGLELIFQDTKDRSVKHSDRIYVPFNDVKAFNYFSNVSKKNPNKSFEVIRLPLNITPEYVKSINSSPGILSLDLIFKGEKVRSKPFIVPGGRFNEMYGWDSYFIALGLIVDKKINIAKSMVDNLVYQITHYGKILNANRTYYLTRSQPPFLTDMINRVYNVLPKNEGNARWLIKSFKAAMKEYHLVWMSTKRFVPEIGLSRFHPDGIGNYRCCFDYRNAP